MGPEIKKVELLTNRVQKQATTMDYTNPLYLDFKEKFLQIKALAEAGKSANNLELIEKISRQSLDTLNYVLFAMHAKQTELQLTSISAAAAAQDVASELSNIARAYNVELEMLASKKLEPVYANQSAVKGSLYGLLSSMIVSCPSAGHKKSKIVVAVQQTAISTQRIGVYSEDISISLADISKAGNLSSKAKMSSPETTSSSGIGYALAGQFVDLLNSDLQSFSHKAAKGVGFYVPISHQLALI